MKILGALAKPRKDSSYPDGIIKDQGCSLLCYGGRGLGLYEEIFFVNLVYVMAMME